VVGIAGPAGAGKSTLARALADALGDALVLHIDDYQRVTEQPLRQIAQWVERGADFDEFPIPLLPEHLARLKRGERVLDPVSLREIVPRRWLLFETHFGRAHRATGEHIDLLAWIETPLDIALARNVRDLLRPLVDDPRVVPDRGRFAWIDNYLASYLASVRPLLQLQVQRVAGDADIVVDGSAELPRQVEQLKREILARAG
jgi:energy-coupling factor transporter ATP-binding protein EcfA2